MTQPQTPQPGKTSNYWLILALLGVMIMLVGLTLWRASSWTTALPPADQKPPDTSKVDAK